MPRTWQSANSQARPPSIVFCARHDGMAGVELVSPILNNTDTSWAEIRELVACVKENFHVHINPGWSNSKDTDRGSETLRCPRLGNRASSCITTPSGEYTLRRGPSASGHRAFGLHLTWQRAPPKQPPCPCVPTQGPFSVRKNAGHKLKRPRVSQGIQHGLYAIIAHIIGKHQAVFGSPVIATHILSESLSY